MAFGLRSNRLEFTSVCRHGLLTCLASAILSLPLVHGKEASLTGIMLYDSAKGAAYLQLTDILINGKAELRNCTGSDQKIDRSAYGKLPKVALAGATSIVRGVDGVMLLMMKDGGTTCVVPSNLKFEKDESLTPAMLADRMQFQARTLSSSSNSGDVVPPFKPGCELRFVATPDVELAEFLRAQRARSITIWQDYLGRYPASAHAAQAKQESALLLAREGDDSLAAYRKSASSANPSLADLKNAKARAEQAINLAPNYAGAVKLKDGVGSELNSLTEAAKGEWQAYKQALSSHAPGYAHLGNAKKLVDQVLEVNPQFEAAQTLQTSLSNESKTLESSIRGAESLASAKRFDDALTAVVSYRSFAGEEPRIAAIVNAAYKYHFDQGNTLLEDHKWAEAVTELQRAVVVNKTPEATASLTKAQEQLSTSQNKQAADEALARSEELSEQHHYVEAYEALASLSGEPRKMVAEAMQTLEPNYIKEASEKAKTLQLAHTPIRGHADEVGILRAYDLLQSAHGLSEDDKTLKMRLDLLAESLSDYYLQQARRYLQKPLGSGVGMGWLYLDQSQLFQPNREDVRDERTKNSALYQMRSKLSIRVVFRDQTSRKDSAGFVEQMQDAIATGVESSGLPVKVVRASDSSSIDPNFNLVGDVLQHRPIVNSKVDPMESKYRFGAREVPNEEWNKADRDYESANLELQRYQRLLEGVQGKGKKKDIADANDAVEEAGQKVQEARRRRDALPKTIPEDIEKPYTYTKKTIDLSAVVEVSFRILNMGGEAVEPGTPINKTNHTQVIVLENVKPEDTQGVKAQGSAPNESQYLIDVEIDAINTLIKAVVEKVQALPPKILALARKQALDEDLDGAAEKYILYLNATPQGQTPERIEAEKFLQEKFNIRQLASPSS